MKCYNPKICINVSHSSYQVSIIYNCQSTSHTNIAIDCHLVLKQEKWQKAQTTQSQNKPDLWKVMYLCWPNLFYFQGLILRFYNMLPHHVKDALVFCNLPCTLDKWWLAMRYGLSDNELGDELQYKMMEARREILQTRI